MERVPYVHAGAVPPAEEILKQCVLRPGMEDDKTYSHLANMMVFYKKDDTEYKKSVPSRRAAIRGSPVQVVVNHFNVSPSDYAGLTFLGVTRDHLKDGKTAKTHASAAGMFSVCVDGIVTIIQPKGHLGKQAARLGQYVKYLDTKFEIKDKHMQGILLEFDDSFADDAIGRVVEMRTDNVDEVRVKLLPFGARIPTTEEKEESNVIVERDKSFNVGILSGIDNQVKGALKRVDEIKAEIKELSKKADTKILVANRAAFKTAANTAIGVVDGYKAQLDGVAGGLAAKTSAINNAKTKNAFTIAKTAIEVDKTEIKTVLQNAENELTGVNREYVNQGGTTSSMASTSAPMSTFAAPEASAAMDTSTSSSIQSALASSLNREAIRKKRGMDKPKGKEPKGKQPKRRKAMGDDAFPE